MKILRCDEAVPVRIGEVEFLISPLSYEQRMRVLDHSVQSGGKVNEHSIKASQEALRYSLRAVRGVTYHDGSPLELKFNDNGGLTDESLNEVFQLTQRNELTLVVTQWVHGTFGETDVPGVEIDFSKVERLKKS